MSELQTLLTAQRSESSQRFLEIAAARDSALSQIEVLQRAKQVQIREAEETQFTTAAREAQYEGQLDELRVEARRKGEHFVSVLGLVKGTVHALAKEATELSQQINYLSMQHQRLVVVVHELAGTNDDGHPTSTTSSSTTLTSRPMLKPIEGYANEISQVLRAVSLKVLCVRVCACYYLYVLDK